MRALADNFEHGSPALNPAELGQALFQGFLAGSVVKLGFGKGQALGGLVPERIRLGDFVPLGRGRKPDIFLFCLCLCLWGRYIRRYCNGLFAVTMPFHSVGAVVRLELALVPVVWLDAVVNLIEQAADFEIMKVVRYPLLIHSHQERQIPLW